MAQKSATLYARIEPDVKERAEAILSELGMSPSGAVNIFFKQIILQRGLPFEVKLPEPQPIATSAGAGEPVAPLVDSATDTEVSRTQPASEAPIMRGRR